MPRARDKCWTNPRRERVIVGAMNNELKRCLVTRGPADGHRYILIQGLRVGAGIRRRPCPGQGRALLRQVKLYQSDLTVIEN